MDFVKFMSENFISEDLLLWAKMYRNMYEEYGNDLFAQRADLLLNEAYRLMQGVGEE